MDYTDKLLDNNFSDSSNILSDNNQIYDSFDQADEFNSIDLDIDNQDHEEQLVHIGLDDNSEDVKNTPTKNDNYKWTKFEEERVLYVYFKDLVHEPLLTGDQEKEIAAQIKECNNRVSKIDKLLQRSEDMDSKQKKKLLAYKNRYTKKGEQLKSKFIKANLRLVINIAKRHLGRGLALTDLVQEGNLGLIRAVEKFDHTKGV
ncbi:MAG: sigma factor [Thermodesulfobacteriota bacterium]